jgi:hypothetical protein
VFTTVQHGTEEQFIALCTAALHTPPQRKKTKKEGEQKHTLLDRRLVLSLRADFHRHVCGLVHGVFVALQPAKSDAVMFRGMTFALPRDAEAYLTQLLRGGFESAVSCSTRCDQAALFATPGRPTPSVHKHLLAQAGCAEKFPEPTAGLLCVLDGFLPISVEGLKTASHHEQEVWLRSSDVHIHWTSKEASFVERVLRKPLPVSGRHLSEEDRMRLRDFLAGGDCEIALVGARPPTRSEAAPSGKTPALAAASNKKVGGQPHRTDGKHIPAPTQVGMLFFYVMLH